MRPILQSLRLLLILTLLTGVFYPLLVWGAARLLFPDKAGGSLVMAQGRIVGSELLAQPAPDESYFKPRPSAVGYSTVPSGAGNQPWTSRRLHESVTERQAENPAGPTSSDLLTASGSGLDPHLTPEAVRSQLDRVAQARALTESQRQGLNDLVARHIEGGYITPARINILRLNLAMDAAFPK